MTPVSYASRPADASAPKRTLSASEREIAEAAQGRFLDGGVTGCAAGAGLGAVIGAIATDGNGRGALLGAGAGCLVGAVAGLAYVGYVSGNTDTIAARNQFYATAQAQAASDIAKTRSMVASYNNVTARYKNELAQMNAQLRSNKITLQEYDQKIGEAQGMREQMSNVADQLESKIKGMEDVKQKLNSAGQDTQDFNRQRAAQQAHLAQLRGAVKTLSGSIDLAQTGAGKLASGA